MSDNPSLLGVCRGSSAALDPRLSSRFALALVEVPALNAIRRKPHREREIIPDRSLNPGDRGDRFVRQTPSLRVRCSITLADCE